MARKTIGISEESFEVVEKFQKRRDIESPGEALDKLIGIARSRVNALDKYAAIHSAGEKAAKRLGGFKSRLEKDKAKPAKKTAKGAGKARGPLARKVKKVEAAPEDQPNEPISEGA